MTTRRDRPWNWYRVGPGLVVAALVALAGLTVAALWRPDPVAVYEQTLGALEAGRFDAAEAGLERLGRLRAPTVLDWGVRARVAIARGRTDDALAALARIPETHPLSGWSHLRAGQLELRRRRFRKAEAELRRALHREAGLVEARRELVYILGLQLRRRELDEQFRRLSEQATLTPHEVWVWCMSSDLVWWTPGEHSAILQDALRADPEDLWSRLALAETHRRQAHYAAAEEVLRPLPLSDPDARAARAGLALESQDPEAAAALLADGPEGHPALAGLRGRLAIARGDGPAAVRHLQRALAADPGRRGALADLGRAWLLAGDPAKGQPYLAAAARVDVLNNLLLGAEFRTGKADPDLWHRLGTACEAAGRLPQARAWYLLAVRHDPLDPEAQQALHRLEAGAKARQKVETG